MSQVSKISGLLYKSLQEFPRKRIKLEEINNMLKI